MAEDIALNLVSRKHLRAMSSREKVAFILDEVKQDKIVVLEQGLDPAEEASLIERTMVEVDPDTFCGIEIESYRDEPPRDLFGRFRTRAPASRRARMTVVAPADRLRTIRKDSTSLQALILSGRERRRR